LIIGQNRETEVRVGRFSAALPNSAKFGRLVQTLTRLECQPLDKLGDRTKLLRKASGAEALATLRAASSQQPTAALGGHTRSETMRSGTMQITGIKSTFHGATSGKKYGANQ
jgi:hypothetical protein